MRLVTTLALALCVASPDPFAANAAGDQPAGAAGAERLQHWAADHQAMMDARLGGMKEVFRLPPNQYPLWEIFETAVRNADKARTDDMREMMQDREHRSPVDRLDIMAVHMARRAAELKKIAEAAKPFYASMDDAQKRNFGLLGREMLTSRTGARWIDVGGDAGAPGSRKIGKRCSRDSREASASAKPGCDHVSLDRALHFLPDSGRRTMVSPKRVMLRRTAYDKNFRSLVRGKGGARGNS